MPEKSSIVDENLNEALTAFFPKSIKTHKSFGWARAAFRARAERKPELLSAFDCSREQLQNRIKLFDQPNRDLSEPEANLQRSLVALKECADDELVRIKNGEIKSAANYFHKNERNPFRNVDDLVHELFVLLYRIDNPYDPTKANLFKWVCGIAKNICRRVYDRETKEVKKQSNQSSNEDVNENETNRQRRIVNSTDLDSDNPFVVDARSSPVNNVLSELRREIGENKDLTNRQKMITLLFLDGHKTAAQIAEFLLQNHGIDIDQRTVSRDHEKAVAIMKAWFDKNGIEKHDFYPRSPMSNLPPFGEE